LVIKYFGKIDGPVFTGLVFQQIRLSSIVAIVFENVYRDFLSPASLLLLTLTTMSTTLLFRMLFNKSMILINITWKGDIE